MVLVMVAKPSRMSTCFSVLLTVFSVELPGEEERGARLEEGVLYQEGETGQTALLRIKEARKSQRRGGHLDQGAGQEGRLGRGRDGPCPHPVQVTQAT